MTSARFPNVALLLARLDAKSLAHALCSCFDGASHSDDVAAKVQKVLAAQNQPGVEKQLDEDGA